MPALMLIGGMLLFGAAGWAFVYAHFQDATPEADPMAAQMGSQGAYDRLPDGGLGLIAAGGLLIAATAVTVVRGRD
jgi:hypothetical protein